MKKLIVYHGDSPVHVEGFPKDCARSVVGSVHLLPGKGVTVTEDEYQFIKTSPEYKWMAPKLKVLASAPKMKTPEEVKPEEAAASEEAKPEAAATSESAGTSESDASESDLSQDRSESHRKKRK